MAAERGCRLRARVDLAVRAPVSAVRVVSGKRRGSSRPIIVETAEGRRFVKLRGASQGTGALVAEMVVASLAETLDLRVPKRCLVELKASVPTDDKDDELADLLNASVGLNLGFDELAPTRDVQAADLDRMSEAEKMVTLWLDRFVMNPDRTVRNPNILWWNNQAWLIDHGAALRFQYNWPAVTEQSPHAVGRSYEPHLFETMSAHPQWAERDEFCAQRITREVLEGALADVPDSFLEPLLGEQVGAEALRRRRAAYVAFLWKRLKLPCNFAHQPAELTPAGSRGVVPEWVKAGR